MKTYYIHDNGTNTFKVGVNKNEIIIYHKKHEDWTIFKTLKKFDKVFIGKSPKNKMTTFSKGFGKKFDGNSILVEISKNIYLFIGLFIYAFTVKDDEIVKYVSPVGNNDFPYPYAIGKNKTYLMIEKVCIKNEYLTKEDLKAPYDKYYHTDKQAGEWKKYKIKVIHKRNI